MILAAGKGERMLPITMVKPKPMIKVAGRPFIQHLIERLLEAGYKDIGVVLGYKKEFIEGFIKEMGYKIEVIEQKKLVGTAEAVRVCEDYVGKDNFLVVSGDNLYSPRDLARLKNGDGNCYVYASQGSSEGYGQVVVENGFLKEIVEKPEKQISDLINVGLYKFTPEIFDAIKRIKPSRRGEMEIVDAINLLAKERKVVVLEIQDYWLDLLSPENLYAVSEFLTENNKPR